MMTQFEVMRTKQRTYLILIDNSMYDYVWGFYRPIKILEEA